MPLTFSEREETLSKPVDLFKVLNDKVIPEKKKDCSFTKDQTHPVSSALNFKVATSSSSQGCNKSEDELSFDEHNHIYVSEELEEDCIVETTALRQMSEETKSFNNTSDTDNYLTVSGTIKRGKKKGQSVEVILNMSREELEILEANMMSKKSCPCTTTNGSGFHVLLWTVFCFPFSVIISGIYSFCMGTITWYNVFKFFSENRALAFKVLLPPVLLVLYPFLIVSLSTGLGLYAGVRQLSCCWDSWLKEFTDYEKGFYGWLCNSLDIPECCPYEVVILSSVQKP